MPDKDEVKGKAREAMGSVQEKAGHLTGDRDMEAEGEGKKTEGKAQNSWGNVKQAAGNVADNFKP